MKNGKFTFDDMINTMMPLPINGERNGEGLYCRGEELVASMDQKVVDGVRSQSMKEEGFDLQGILSQYCFN